MPKLAFLFCVGLTVLLITGQIVWSIVQDKTTAMASAQASHLLTVRVLEAHASRVLHEASSAMSAAADEIEIEGGLKNKSETSLRQLLIHQHQDKHLVHALSIMSNDGVWRGSSVHYPARQIALQEQKHLLFC